MLVCSGPRQRDPRHLGFLLDPRRVAHTGGRDRCNRGSPTGPVETSTRQLAPRRRTLERPSFPCHTLTTSLDVEEPLVVAGAAADIHLAPAQSGAQVGFAQGRSSGQVLPAMRRRARPANATGPRMSALFGQSAQLRRRGRVKKHETDDQHRFHGCNPFCAECPLGRPPGRPHAWAPATVYAAPGGKPVDPLGRSGQSSGMRNANWDISLETPRSSDT
jgi:hypothetical protein